ncbi:MAG: carbohydrate kinase [Chitinophagaceae bacterium]|nr:carbohydrate kinase [Chitinophagaceae bacterium]
MHKSPVIAIFDIGKTNKKLFLFDEQYNMLYEKSEGFAETIDEDGDACEDLALLTGWAQRSLEQVSQAAFDVTAVNFSAYGASFVHIDREGTPVAPLYNYLKPYPKNIQQQFYDRYGSELVFSMQTASPVLGNLNSGLQLYMLKYQKPGIFQKIHYSLHLPQYLNFLVTGRPYSDITSIGCHTGLWNFSQNHYHEWIYREEISGQLAPIFPSDQVMRCDYNKKPILSGIGLHDSSAALIPYLSNFTEPFVLISTGTWCISLNPFNQTNLTAEELQQDCLSYMEYRGKPVKASRLFAGYEHEQQVKKLAAQFNVANDFYKTILFDIETVNRLQNRTPPPSNEKKQMLQQSAFAARDLLTFSSYAEAYHQLMIDLIKQQVISTDLVLKNCSVKRIFLDGGFSRNPVYMNLLAAAYPEMEVYAASMAQASALGAALAIHPYWSKKSLPADLIELKYYTATETIM